jgi:predicted HAD superfamily Cof-like phosphohydrolase
MSSTLSDYEKVREFTIGAGQEVTEKPAAMNKAEAKFLLRMCLSELQELALSVTNNNEEAFALLKECVETIDHSKHEELPDEDSVIAAQADSIVDLWYYALNAFSKKSVDLSAIFNVVHNANMAKRDPVTKKFIRRESDGKIIKPPGWTPPDIVAEVKRQRNQ